VAIKKQEMKIPEICKKLEYKQTVKYTHKMPDSKEWRKKWRKRSGLL
jgi:hypothetical protein